MINFEFPVGEKVRNLLRLENVFHRIDFCLSRDQAYDHHHALMALFEIGEMGSRGDLRADLLQELERQRQMLQSNLDAVLDQNVVESALAQCEQVMQRLQQQTGRLGYHLRDNEWLNSIYQRGQKGSLSCFVDFPSYHFWLNQATAVRVEDLSRWLEPILPVRDAVALLLRILRTRGETFDYVAKKGRFYEKSDGGRVIHLLQVRFAANLPVFPELSAGKYAISMRFLESPDRQSRQLRSVETSLDVPFQLTCCRL